MRKFLLSSVLFLLIVSYVWSADVYAEEKRTIEDFTHVMETYITAIDGSDALESIINAIMDLTVNFEGLIPLMEAMSNKYPDWGDNPPPELKETMARYEEIGTKFFMESMQKTVRYANTHQDNKALQEAFGKLNLVMSQIGGRASE